MAKKPNIITDEILEFIKGNSQCSSNEILNGISAEVSIATLKRALQELVAEGLIITIGELKSRKYELSPAYNIIRPIEIDKYFEKEIDERTIQKSFNQTLVRDTLKHISVFTKVELILLNELQEKFKSNAAKLSASAYKNELERLAIDLSWKSFQIEGNTYSLLETERLLKDKGTAAGKTKDEQTNINPFKKVFIDQFEFAVNTYF